MMKLIHTIFILFFFCGVYSQEFTLGDPSSPFLNHRKVDADFADVDGDGDLDMIFHGDEVISFGEFSAQLIGHSQLYLNDGSGFFTSSEFQGFDDLESGAVAFEDIDNDGDPDVLLTGEIKIGASFRSLSKIYLNDGNGIFEEDERNNIHGVRFSTINFFDIDSDGDSDLLISGKDNDWEFVSKLYQNNGEGIFEEIPKTPFFRGKLETGDVDGDGDVDVLILGEIDETPKTGLFLNDGEGVFTESEQLLKQLPYGTMQFVDIDNDNDLDAILYGFNTSRGYDSILYKNDGSGNFQRQDGTAIDDADSAITLFDVDNDDDLDLFFAKDVEDNNWEQELFLYFNQGISTTSNQELNFEALNIFPNPSNGESINITLNEDFSNFSSGSISDLNGSMISSFDLPRSLKEDNFSVDVSYLNAGMYIIKLEGQDKIKLGKIIIVD